MWGEEPRFWLSGGLEEIHIYGCLNYIIFYLYRRPKEPMPNALRAKKMCPSPRGGGPLWCKTLPCKNQQMPYQGQPTIPTKPRTIPTLPTKDNRQDAKTTLDQTPDTLTMLHFSIPFQLWIVPSTKDIPSAPCLIKTLEHGRNGETANRNSFNHPFPHRLGVDNKFIPNTVCDFEFMPLFMVKNFVILLNPNGAMRDTPKGMPNFNHFTIYLFQILSPF